MAQIFNQDVFIVGELGAQRIVGDTQLLRAGYLGSTIDLSSVESQVIKYNFLLFECIVQEDYGVAYYETVIFDRRYQGEFLESFRYGNNDCYVEKEVTEQIYYIGSSKENTSATCVAVYGIGGY